MLTLALESSAKAASAALCDGDELIAQSIQTSGLTHSRTLLPMAEDLLKNSDYKLSDLELIAVAHGPGSFTGIRIGVSTAKGLAWAMEIPACGVSTLGAMAWHGVGSPEETIICPVMDARRNEVYNALFDIEKDGGPQRCCPDRAIPLEDLGRELRESSRPVLLIGDGGNLARNYLTENGFDPQRLRIPSELYLNQSAWAVAMEAQRSESYSSQELIPVYLRLSQAERERQEKNKKSCYR